MDHNFEDAMNMAGSVEVDFGEGQTVTTEAMDHEMVMDFDLNEQRPISMDLTGEEVVTEYLEDFAIPSGSTEYVQSGSEFVQTGPEFVQSGTEFVQCGTEFVQSGTEFVPSGPEFVQPGSSEFVTQTDIPMATTSDSTIVTSLPKPIFQMQSFEGQTVVVQPQQEPTTSVARPPGRPPRQLAPAPKIVPIAPKPAPQQSPFLVPGKSSLKIGNFQVKKLSMSNAIPGQKQVLAQIGKQLVVMPANSGPKFRIVPPGGAGQPLQAQIISGKSVLAGSASKPIVMKIPGMGNSDTSAVLTKIVPQTSTAQTSKTVTMHPKTVPVPNNILLTSVLNRPQQQVTANQQAGTTTKKVIMISNAAQSLIRKQALDGKIVTKIVQPKLTKEGQQTQIHQIHVPGKGVQYIRLVTNSNAPNNINKRPVINKPQPQAEISCVPKMTYVIDDKGKVVPAGNKAVTTTTAAPTENTIVVTSGTKAAAAQNAGVTRKLVRIAPVTAKAMAQPAAGSVKNRVESQLDGRDQSAKVKLSAEQEPNRTSSLQALIQEIVDGNIPDNNAPGNSMPEMIDVEAAIDAQQIKREPNWSLPPPPPPDPEIPKEHPLIVIPPDYYATTPREERKVKFGKIRFELPKVEDVESCQDYEIEAPSSPGHLTDKELDLLKPRKACNCTKSQCLKLYCDCFANGEFCNNCNCNNCHNNLESEEARQKAIRGCLERNPNAFRPKIGKTKATGPAAIRRHNKGCNCKRSGCLKNYCECYEAKIACSGICKCVGCRNVDDRHDRRREFERRETNIGLTIYRSPNEPLKQPCMFMTSEVIDAVCQCLLAAAGDDNSDRGEDEERPEEKDPLKCVIEEFSRCLQDIISASHQPPPTLDETA